MATFKSTDPQPGDEMPDGIIYAGISPDTMKPMYVLPGDAPRLMTFNEAAEYAVKLHAHGRRDWRMPTAAELNLLFSNRLMIGGFNLTGVFPRGWYWTATATEGNSWCARSQRFSDGCPDESGKVRSMAVRCVR
jgi:hypothetical protein